MTAKIGVRVVCLHGRRGGPPETILERDVWPRGAETPAQRAIEDYFQANPDVDPEDPLPPELSWAVIEIVIDAGDSLRAGNRGRWINRDGEIVSKVKDLRAAGTRAMHQFHCKCGITERVSERDLSRALAFAATQDTRERQVVPLGGIGRYSRAID